MRGWPARPCTSPPRSFPSRPALWREGVVSSEGGRSTRAGRRGVGAAPRRHEARAFQSALPARDGAVGEHGTAQRGQEEHSQDPDGPESQTAGESVVVEEERKGAPETEEPVAETPQDLVEAGEAGET